DALVRAARITAHDEVILATSHATAKAVWFAWPAGRRLVRSGADGADLALLDVIHGEALADRFDRVVIASGDGIFAPACAELDAAGCRVLVVSRPGALSRRLAAVAPELALIDDPAAPPPPPMSDRPRPRRPLTVQPVRRSPACT
ncbi:MAG: NYN domain-containing protein, partial [Solirubrobacteraceae bacterium]|nr:NYN domain-containing protein [Solirubrobacteraceae bacterium]